MNKKDAVRTKEYENLPKERRDQVKFVSNNLGKIKKYLELCRNNNDSDASTRESLRKWIAAAGLPTDVKRLEGLVQQCGELSVKAKKATATRYRKPRHSAKPRIEEEDNDDFNDALNFGLENGLSSRQAEIYAQARTSEVILELLRGQ
jgi:hypothetical protein